MCNDFNGLYNFIRDCDLNKKPLIGSCFGHQAIAVALGIILKPSKSLLDLISCLFAIESENDARPMPKHEDTIKVIIGETIPII